MKTTFTFLFIFFLAFSYVSCSNEEVSDANEVPELIGLNTIKELAISHNEALGYVLKGLKEHSVSSDDFDGSIAEIVNNRLNTFYASVLVDEGEVNSAIALSEEMIFSRITLDNRIIKKKNSDLSPIQTIIQENSSYLSETQVELLNDIDDILANFDDNLDGNIERLEQIENTAMVTLTEDQALPILAGVEIGKASLSYWFDNFEEWAEVLVGDEEIYSKMRKWFSWGSVVGGDIEGAIGAAVGVAVANAVPGAGQAAYGAAILGGAAGGSVGNAIGQLVTHILE